MFLQGSVTRTRSRQDPQLESKFLLYVVSTLVNIVSRINYLSLFHLLLCCFSQKFLYPSLQKFLWKAAQKQMKQFDVENCQIWIFFVESMSEAYYPHISFCIRVLIKLRILSIFSLKKTNIFSQFWEFEKIIINIGENRIGSFIW